MYQWNDWMVVGVIMMIALTECITGKIGGASDLEIRTEIGGSNPACVRSTR